MASHNRVPVSTVSKGPYLNDHGGRRALHTECGVVEVLTGAGAAMIYWKPVHPRALVAHVGEGGAVHYYRRVVAHHEPVRSADMIKHATCKTPPADDDDLLLAPSFASHGKGEHESSNMIHVSARSGGVYVAARHSSGAAIGNASCHASMAGTRLSGVTV